LESFLVLAEELSFARAAEKLRMSQPALSRQIRKLEDKIGVRLFERTTRKVGLTRAGESFRINAGAILGKVDEACQMARRLDEGLLGELRIGYTDFAISGPLTQVVRAFRQHFPDVTTTLARGATERQFRDLESGALDVGFVLPPVPSGGLTGSLAWRERFVVVMPEQHPLAGCRRIDIARLDGHAMVVGEADRWGAYRRHLEALLKPAGVQVDIAAEGPDAQVILGLVEAGFGLALLPECIANLSRRGLVIRPLEARPGPEHWIETHICWHRENKSDLLANFRSVCGDTLAARAVDPAAPMRAMKSSAG